MPTKNQLAQIKMSHEYDHTPERALHYTGGEEVLVYPTCDVSSLAPCSHDDADTILFAHAVEAAKRAYKKKKQSHC